MLKKILFICDLDFSFYGNQVLFQTIIGTIRNGYNVTLLTSAPLPHSKKNKIDHRIPLDCRTKLKIIRFNTFFRKIFISKLLSNYSTQSQSGFTHYPFYSFISFFLGGFIPAIKQIILTKKPNYICGYEPRGVILGWFVSKLCGVEFYSRFQGTILYPELKNKYTMMINFFFYWLAIKLPAKLIYMGNDGTRGDEVIKKLCGNNKNMRFRIDGIKKVPQFSKNYVPKVKKYFIKNEMFTILTVSRLEYWKRVDRIINSLFFIKKKNPNIKLLIIGEGNDKIRLEKISKKLGLINDITFLGNIPQEIVYNYYKVSDLFVSLYNYSNLCNPILEALQSGRVILSFDDHSTKGVLFNNKNAVLVKASINSQELANVILKLILKHKFRQSLSTAAKKYADHKLLFWKERMKLEKNDLI